MNMSPAPEGIPPTVPEFLPEARRLAALMRRFSAEELGRMLRISPRLARETFDRYRSFDDPAAPQVPALFAYDGSVFRHIGPRTLPAAELRYAQPRLRIASALYGLLAPLDAIRVYRLEFAAKPDGLPGSLYDFWRPRLTAPLIAQAQVAGGILVNLGSLDLLPAFDIGLLTERVRLITPEFMERQHGGLQTVRTYAKMARGEMVRHILTHRIEQPEALKEFEWNGFAFSAKDSDASRYRFVRTHPSPRS